MAGSCKRDLVAVVGNGPIGASVARALGARGKRVELFSSPTLWSSHDDCGRITRVIDFEHAPEWISWNKRSLGAWRALEEQSGVQFYNECGSAVLDDDVSKLEDQLGNCAYSRLDCRADLAGACGDFVEALSEEVVERGVFEPHAGYVNPRDLIAAQNKILMESYGGAVHRETVSEVNADGTFIELRTDENTRAFEQVVLCAGAFTSDLLRRSGMPALPYKVSRRTVLLGEISQETKDGVLAKMPALKLSVRAKTRSTNGSTQSVRDAREAASVYILPPIWYEEYGGYYLKIGGGPNDFIESECITPAAEAWHRASYQEDGGHPEQVAFLKETIAAVFRAVPFLKWKTKNCITTSARDEPLFREVRCENRLLVVANCQGKAVTASAAIGEDVADMVVEMANRLIT